MTEQYNIWYEFWYYPSQSIIYMLILKMSSLSLGLRNQTFNINSQNRKNSLPAEVKIKKRDMVTQNPKKYIRSGHFDLRCCKVSG